MAAGGQWVKVSLNQPFAYTGRTQGGSATTIPIVQDWHWSVSSVTSATDLPQYFRGTTPGVLHGGIINMLPDGTKEDFKLTTWPGQLGLATFTRSITVTAPRGIHYSPVIGKVIEGWDDDLLVDGTATSAAFANGATAGPIGFADGFDSTNTAYCFVSSDTDSLTVNSSGTVTAVSDGDLPDPAIPTPVFMDTYIFLAKENSRSIYNSSPGDPTSWQASTFINTEETAGPIVGLAKHKKHLVALCTDHIEFFRDAGIPSPNSPLLRVSELMVQIGCSNRATICNHEDDVYFVGRTPKSSHPGVFRIRENKVDRISTPDLDRVLNQQDGAGYKHGVIVSPDWSYATNSTAPTTNYTTMYFTVVNNRPMIFLIVKNGTVFDLSTNVLHGFPSFAYDILTETWIIMQYHQTEGSAHCYGGLPWNFGTVYKTSASGTFSIYISRVKTNNNIYYYWGDGTSMIFDVSTPSVSDAGNAFMMGVLVPKSDWGFPGRKTISGIDLEIDTVGTILEPSATPFTFTVLDDWEGATGGLTTSEWTSINMYPSSEWTFNKKRVRTFAGGSHDRFGLFIRFRHAAALSQVIDLQSVKIYLTPGVR